MATLEQFSRSDVLRIVGITAAQLHYWERLRLIEPQNADRQKVYGFRDLIHLRTVKQITAQRVPARRLLSALQAFRRQWPEAEAPLGDLRFVSDGRQVAVEYRGTCIEPVSGQLLLDFEGGGREGQVCAMPERSLEDSLSAALECEGDPTLRRQAIEAYQNLLAKAPGWLEPRLNLGTLYYEEGNLTGAAVEFRRAVEIAPDNPLAHFNLGSVLDDLNQLEAASSHLEDAVRLAPSFADAHYNLARVYEKLNTPSRARQHWRRYLELDPSSPWAEFARSRLRSDEQHSRPLAP
jgi:tetratricopeptide (TPR) repeat protein